MLEELEELERGERIKHHLFKEFAGWKEGIVVENLLLERYREFDRFGTGSKKAPLWLWNKLSADRKHQSVRIAKDIDKDYKLLSVFESFGKSLIDLEEGDTREILLKKWEDVLSAYM